MKHRILCLICCAQVVVQVVAQERFYERPFQLQRTAVMDRGDGRSYIAAQRTFGLDSTQLYLLSDDPDHQLTLLGGLRLQFPNAILNDAAAVPNGVIMVGAHMGFSTIPFALHMDSLGQVQWCITFPGLVDGQDQIANVVVSGDRMDLFTWGGPEHSFYRISGMLDGSIIQSQRIIAPPTIDHRINEVVSTGDTWGQVVISNSSAAGGDQGIYVMLLDSMGIVWEVAHDHGSGASPQFEMAQNMVRTMNGDLIYSAGYTITNNTAIVSRLVRMNASGTIIWSKEFLDGNDHTAFSSVIETSDSSLLVAARNVTTNSTLLLKLDAAGEVLVAKRYVQSLTSGTPVGRLYNFGPDRLLAYGQTAFTELDMDLGACDLVPTTTITAVDALPNVLPTSLLTVIETPTVNTLTTVPRSGIFSNQLDCTHTGQDEAARPSSIRVFPVPAHDLLTLDMEPSAGT